MLFAVAREHQSRFRQDSRHIQPFLAPIQCCLGPPYHHPPPEFRAGQGLTSGTSSPLVGETLLTRNELCPFSNSQYYPELHSTFGHVLHLQVRVWERFFRAQQELKRV